MNCDGKFLGKNPLYISRMGWDDKPNMNPGNIRSISEFVTTLVHDHRYCLLSTRPTWLYIFNILHFSCILLLFVNIQPNTLT
jgi:hypothetical protein